MTDSYLIQMKQYKDVELRIEENIVSLNGNFSLTKPITFATSAEAGAFAMGVKWATEYSGGKFHRKEEVENERACGV